MSETILPPARRASSEGHTDSVTGGSTVSRKDIIVKDGGEMPDKAAIRAVCLANHVVAPDLATIKGFLRRKQRPSLINTSLPILPMPSSSLQVSNGLPGLSSINRH